jgi:predicted O-methyltransferase YrrM
VVSRDFYSPVPDIASLSSDVWTRRSPLRGLAFDIDAQLAFLAEQLGPHLAELQPPSHSDDPARYHLDNSYYRSVEAEALHAMIRHLKPARVVELGSGFSSLIIAEACEANRRDGNRVDYRIYDPFPDRVRAALAAGLDGIDEVVPLGAADVPDSVFAQLGDGDVLFVDTTHTIKVGGDVNHIVLDVLPTLAPGVAVHFHDVFLPWEYPRSWVEDMERYWAEQYLLQAFLAHNDCWEVLLATYAVTREHPAEVARLVPSFEPARARPDAPAAFWLRRVANESLRRD